jgi:aspartyl-tRNA(Asn)/glutamyl-tRNA(Gln) amidotransferase subunit B
MVERALLYEQKRQAALLEQGEKVVRETRGWLDKKGVTAVQRGKEEASDYRYFPEPDLPPFVFSDFEIEKIRTTIGELPRQRKERFMKKLGLSLKEAATLTESKELADYFEEVLKEGISPKKAANWILVELLGALREEGKEFDKQRIPPSDLAELIKLIEKGSISGKIGKEVFRQMLKTGSSPQLIIKNQQLRLVKDEQLLYEAIREVLKNQPAACADYRRGKSEALQFLIGQVMKLTKGQADPLLTRKMLIEALNEGKTN